MSINEQVTQKATKVERKAVLNEFIKTTHICSHLHEYTHTYSHRNNLEGIPNYKQMYSLILLQHFIIGGCDLH